MNAFLGTPAGKRRLALLLAILGFWLVMTGLLVRREWGGSSFDPRTLGLARLDQPTESWLALLGKGGEKRLGYVHLQQIPETRDELEGITLRMTTRMSLELFGRTTELDLAGWAFRPYVGQPASFDFQVRSGDHDFRVAGSFADGTLRGAVTSAGEVLPLELPVDDQLLFGTGFGSAIGLPRLAVGEIARIETFDPLTLRSTQALVRCSARERLIVRGQRIETRVLEIDAAGLRSRAWVDEAGEVVRAETALGLILERTTAEAALAPPSAGGGSDFLALTAIRPSGAPPGRGQSSMRFRARGAPDTGLPTDALQTREGDLYRRTAPASLGAIPQEPLLDPTPYLRSDAFVQADHPRLRAQAQAILTGAPEAAWPRALLLYDWVYHEIDKQAVLSIPSALEVLEKRRGDCNEHTVLYAALARAAGIPTRISIGIVWSDELEGFYYHAWPEVYTGTGWAWVDPTLGQPLADATHIKLASGGVETWPQLLPYLGRLELEILP